MSDRIQIVLNFIDKVSFAGIFNKLFHPLTLPLSPNLGERGRVRGSL